MMSLKEATLKIILHTSIICATFKIEVKFTKGLKIKLFLID